MFATVALTSCCFIGLVLTEVAILKSPKNISDVLIGETAVFTCEAKADLIIFFINAWSGTFSADKIQAFELGFTEMSAERINQSTIYKNLSVVTGSQNNNTFIECRALNINDSFDQVDVSQPAHLFVEGVLILQPGKTNGGISPLTKLTHVGDQNVFRCVARAKIIDFLINGTSAAYQSNYEKGFVESSINYVTSSSSVNHVQRTLTVTSSVKNNNTFISCRAINSITSKEIDVKYREVALLIVHQAKANNLLLNTNLPLSFQSNTSTALSNTTVIVEIVAPPKPATVILGKNGTFTCSAKTENIYFVINDDQADIEGKGFYMNLTTRAGNTYFRELEAVGSKSNNNSLIRCIAITFYGDGNKNHSSNQSSKVLFQVQGPLAAVPHLYVVWLNSTRLSANISWDRPFTLPGTNITRYDLTFTTLPDEPEEILNETSTKEQFYLWNTSCTRVTVSAYNGWKGNISSRLVVPRPYVTIANNSINIANEYINISLFLDISESIACFYQFMPSIRIKMRFVNETLFHTFDARLLNLTNVTLISDMITLKANEEYRAQVRYSYSTGDHHFSSELDKFKPQPLLNVVLLHHHHPTNSYHGEVQFDCVFVSQNVINNVKGCTVRLVSKSNSSIHFSNSANKTTTTDKHVIVSINDVDDGQYKLEGYIIETTESSVLAYIDDDLEVTNYVPPSSTSHITPSSTGSFTHSPSPTSGNGDTELDIIIGIIVASVIFVVIICIVCCVISCCIYMKYKREKRAHKIEKRAHEIEKETKERENQELKRRINALEVEMEAFNHQDQDEDDDTNHQIALPNPHYPAQADDHDDRTDVKQLSVDKIPISDKSQLKNAENNQEEMAKL